MVHRGLRADSGQRADRGDAVVGLPEKELEEALLARLAQITIGRTGYVYILRGMGEERGQYVLSRDRKRDGENIWDVRDSDGRPFVQQIVQEAVTSPPDFTGEIQYPWKNVDDAVPIMKMARFKYFAPWDWVIASSIPIDELMATPRAVARLNHRSNVIAIVATLLSFLVAEALWTLVSRKLRRQAATLEEANRRLAREMESRLQMEVELRQAQNGGYRSPRLGARPRDQHPGAVRGRQPPVRARWHQRFSSRS